MRQLITLVAFLLALAHVTIQEKQKCPVNQVFMPDVYTEITCDYGRDVVHKVDNGSCVCKKGFFRVYTHTCEPYRDCLRNLPEDREPCDPDEILAIRDPEEMCEPEKPSFKAYYIKVLGVDVYCYCPEGKIRKSSTECITLEECEKLIHPTPSTTATSQTTTILTTLLTTSSRKPSTSLLTTTLTTLPSTKPTTPSNTPSATTSTKTLTTKRTTTLRTKPTTPSTTKAQSEHTTQIKQEASPATTASDKKALHWWICGGGTLGVLALLVGVMLGVWHVWRNRGAAVCGEW